MKFYHSGSGAAHRWCAQRYDIWRDDDGGMLILNQEMSTAYETREEAETAFGPERDVAPRVLRNFFPWIPKE